MLQRVSIFILALAAVTIIAAPASARSLRHLNPIPFSHSPCSVLSEGPCTPYYCSPLDHGPCIPEIDYPIGQNLQLTILSKPDNKDAQKYVKPDHDLDTIGDLFAALRACWTPPPEDEARAGMQMSVKFSFKRDGGLIAPPRVTYATDGVSTQTRDVYLGAIKDALSGCTPLTLSKGLGGAIAGRPIMIRYVDNRALDKDHSPPAGTP
jgi:hypothetical protein